MSNLINISHFIGKKYGRLTILSEAPRIKKYKRRLFVQCDCGKIKSVAYSEIIYGDAKSCGCLMLETASKTHTKHGKCNTNLNGVYRSIKARCYNKNVPTFMHYGGRGISMCEEWRTNYISFHNWAVRNNYQSGLEIDRINNHGNYEPGNCRFVSKKINIRNRRVTKFYEFNGENKSLAELCELYNISYNTAKMRLIRGWAIEKAVTEKVK